MLKMLFFAWPSCLALRSQECSAYPLRVSSVLQISPFCHTEHKKSVEASPASKGNAFGCAGRSRARLPRHAASSTPPRRRVDCTRRLKNKSRRGRQRVGLQSVRLETVRARAKENLCRRAPRRRRRICRQSRHARPRPPGPRGDGVAFLRPIQANAAR